jgi:hypothetical protein
VAIGQHGWPDRINIGTVGRAARRMRVACSGDTPSTRIGGIKKCADPGGNAGTDATALIIISDVEINLDRLPDDPALLQQMLRDAVTTGKRRGVDGMDLN